VKEKVAMQSVEFNYISSSENLADILTKPLAKEAVCKGDWAQDSRRILSYITVCGYDTTHLQENPQRLG